MAQQMQFTKATKEQAKLRLALFGPSGAGKTFTALRIATGMGGTIALIDTEHGSASKYADRFEFDALNLDNKDITTYCQAIEIASAAGYNVLIIDSLSHAWQELLDSVDRISKSPRYRGNYWAAWREGTPQQRAFVEVILGCECHIIATMRSKTEWTKQEGNDGKEKYTRVGLEPIQGKGIEYEFDMLIDLSTTHTAEVIKDRTGKYQDVIIELPGEDLGAELVQWLSDGDAPRPRVATGSRPYPAETTISKLRERAKWYKGQDEVWHRQPDDQQAPPDKKEVQRAAALLGIATQTIGENTESNEAKRHALVKAIFGFESLNNCTDAEAKALLAWAEGEKGTWTNVNEYVRAEAAAILALSDEQDITIDVDATEEIPY